IFKMLILIASLLTVGLAAPLDNKLTAVTNIEDSPSYQIIDFTKPFFSFHSMLKVVEDKLRKKFLKDGVPAGAVDEFIGNGFLYPPYNENKIESLVHWAKKWKIDEWKAPENTNYHELLEVENELERAFTWTFDSLCTEAVRELSSSQKELFKNVPDK
ncbi:hypothetical protein PFISCL1PPCAC_473, partial [Pristionchus fissidentatus]